MKNKLELLPGRAGLLKIRCLRAIYLLS